MTQPEIVALRCPSCGGGLVGQSRENSLDNRYYCDGCGTTCVLVVDREAAPLKPSEEPWLNEDKPLRAGCNEAAAIRVVHKANKGMGLYEAKVFVDSLKADAPSS